MEDSEGSGRGRGRARGRGRGEEQGGDDQQPPHLRRPGEPGFPSHQALSETPGLAGRASAGPTHPFGQASGGRASGGGDAGGRGAVRGGIAGAGAAPPGARATGAPVAGGSVGRGASRGREQRMETVVFTRPSAEFDKRGKDGMQLPLAANYFELISRPDMHMLQYRVDFAPEVDHMGVRKALVRVHEQTLGKYLFDGTLLYNVRQLPQPLEVFSNRLSDDVPIKITFRLVGEVHKEDAAYTTIMNIIFRRCLGMLNLVLLRRDYYDAEAAQEITNHALTIWPGYLTTLRHYENSFLLVVEIVHKVLRRDTALDVLNKIRQEGGDLSARAKAELLGKVVMTHYNKRTYRIDDIDFEQNGLSTFHLRKEDKDISYVDYYKNRYHVDVRYPKQPLLVSRPTRRDLNRGEDKPIYLLPELCGMTGLTDDQKKNFQLMKDVGNVTRVVPDRRVDALMKFRKRIADNPDIQRDLNSWGLKFSDELVHVPGRKINPMPILQGGSANYSSPDGDWSRNIQRNQMSVCVELTDWAVFFPANMGSETRNFVQLIKETGRGQNFQIPEPTYYDMQQDRTSNYVDSLRHACDQREFNIVMCVMRAARADTYSAVKKLTCSEYGVPSQVITGRILRGDNRKLMSIATKVMIQIGAKMGAEPWRVSLPNTTWMVCGYDTYHDAKQSKAVGAFIASINPSFSRYSSSVKIHENNEEISPSFKDHLKTSLKSFYQNNDQNLPTKIIVYRDGVGASDIHRLKETEVAALKEACSEVSTLLNWEARKGNPYMPGIAFVVVSKRINTRFFAMQGRPANPPCGTVVDSVVTLNERFDFFLVSQKVTQGTVSPTGYNIVEDTGNLSPDIHQRLAYALTHLYYNWPGTLRLPAPVQYAHKLAYLVGESVMQTPHVKLTTLPFYL